MPGVEKFEAFKAPERVQAGERLAVLQDPLKGFPRRFIAALDDEALCRVPPPAIGMVEVACQFDGGELLESGGRAPVLVLVAQTIDATMSAARLVESTAQDLLAQVGSDIGPVLDDPVVHVQDVEGVVWGSIGIDRAEALVSGGEEFLLAESVFADQFAVSVLVADRLDQVASGLGDEGGSIEVSAEAVAAEDSETGSAGGIDEFVVLR